MDLDPATESILQKVHYKCKVTTNDPCSARPSSCRKNGLICILACSNCHGQERQDCKVAPKDERNVFELFESFM